MQRGGGKQKTVTVVAIAATLALVASTCLAMSIETEPVKVTHRNSGPRYELASENEVERTRMRPAEESQPEQPQEPPMMVPAPSGEQETSGEPTPIGHVAIRRIYLFPMMTRGPSEWSSNGEGEQQQGPSSRGERPSDQEMPSMFARPFWPFLTPARHHEQSPPAAAAAAHRPHLFGADEASRSPATNADQDQAASGEREQEHRHHQHQQQLDPIQMMLDMMHQAISAQMVPPSDLSNKGDNAPAETSSDERPKMPGGSEMAAQRPAKPMAQNETSEDIVEIEGKKYLRKTVVNRHIGENIIFMTKRLIFVPLNETDSAAPATTETVATTTTTDSITTTVASPAAAEESSSVIPDRVGENKPATTTTTESPTEAPAAVTTVANKVATEEAVTITAKSEPLSTIAPSLASTEQAAATTTVANTEVTPAESTTTTTTTPVPTESFVDRVAEVTERMVEELKPASTSSATTTEAPAISSDKPQ